MATVVGLFNTFAQAQTASAQIEAAGIQPDAASLVANNTHAESGAAVPEGMRALALPGIGMTLARGTLAESLHSVGDGIFGGDLFKALVKAGIPDEDAHLYAEGVRRGGSLLTVQADDAAVARVYEAMQQDGAVDIDAASAKWRQSGWNGFDSSAQPYRGEQIENEDGAPANTDVNPEDHSIAASVGALSGGMIPGTFGAAGSALFGNEDAERRPDYERD